MTIMTNYIFDKIVTNEHNVDILMPILDFYADCSIHQSKLKKLLFSSAMFIAEYCRIYPAKMNVSITLKKELVGNKVSLPYYPIISTNTSYCKIYDQRTIICEKMPSNNIISYQCGYTDYSTILEQIKYTLKEMIKNQINHKIKQDNLSVLRQNLGQFNSILI